MKRTPKYQDPQNLNRLKQKYGPLNKKHVDLIGNPEGGKEVFWFLYLAAMIVYIFNIMNK
jgi:hypothetical protein